jgi:soluble lytic murein transglycosylase
LETTQVARLLAQIGEADLGRLFLAKNIDLARTPGERELVAALAISQGQPDIAVVIARQSERQGAPMIQAGYPIVATAADDPAPEQALVLSLILKESAFHADLVSGAGARGLMQLLPGTAAQMAKSLKLANADKDAIAPQLIRDPALNIRLGSDYVGSLLADFNGSYVLATAAYNAGPNRVKRWLPDIGDPRTGVDPIDWIENIPYWETRDYVQRVLEAAQIYRRKLGAAKGFQLERDLRR